MAPRNSFTARSGLSLSRTPNHRVQVARRRWVVIGTMAALAMVSALVGAVGGSPPTESAFGPFSHFPSE